MYPRDDLRSCARHIVAQCREAVLASRLARVDDARERPRRSFRKIGRSTSLVNREKRPIHAARRDGCCARDGSSGDATTRSSSLRHAARRRIGPDGVGRGVSTWCLAAVLWRHYRFGFMRSYCSRSRSIPFNVPPLSGRRRPDEHTPRGHLRPDKVGRERPPSEWVRDRLRGWQRGSLTPPARVPPSSARRPRRHRTPPHSR
jgi:hypothetical protein